MVADMTSSCRYKRVHADGLYERYVLAWSQHQAGLLRRLGRGESVNDVDWANLAAEIEALVDPKCTRSKAFSP
jgi:hypothetical protein